MTSQCRLVPPFRVSGHVRDSAVPHRRNVLADGPRSVLSDASRPQDRASLADLAPAPNRRGARNIRHLLLPLSVGLRLRAHSDEMQELYALATEQA
jgi:hypothetical protein